MTSISSCCGADVAVKGDYFICHKCLAVCNEVDELQYREIQLCSEHRQYGVHKERERIIEKLEGMKKRKVEWDWNAALDAAIKAIKNEI